MKKNIPITIGLLFSFSSITLANNTLNPVKVTAKGFDSSLYTETTDINTIYIDELSSMQNSLAEILSNLPGVQISQYGGPSQTTTLQIDGINLKNTLVLLDGQVIGSATLGQASLNRIPVSQIEKIEVLKGSGSALYGSSAIGGVINLISKRNYNNVSITTGSFNTNKIVASIHSNNSEKSHIGLNVNLQSTDGINARTGTYYDYTNSAETEYDSDKDGSSNQAISGYFNISPLRNLNIENSFFFNQGTIEYDGAGYDDQSEYEATQLNSKIKTKFDDLDILISASRQTDSSLNFGVINSKYNADEFTTITHNLDFQSQFSNNYFEAVTGIEWKQDDISDSKLNSNYEKNTIDNTSLFSQTSFKAHPHFLIALGLRVDEHSAFGSHFTYNSSLSSNINNHKITITAESGFKAPTFNDLFYPGSGNPDLQPEESIQKSVRYTYHTIDRTFTFKAYQTDLDNLIAWAPTSADPNIWKPSNVNKSVIKGWRFSLTENWNDAFSTSFSASRTLSENLSDNQQLALTPEYAVKAKMSYRKKSLLLSSSINHVGEKLDSTRNIELDSYTLVDIAANYDFTQSVSASLLIQNIADVNYTPNSNYSGTPFNFIVSVNYQH